METPIDINKLQPRDRIRYKGQEAIVTAIDKHRISFFLEERREFFTNIPLHERRPGEKYTNAKFITR